MSNRQLRTKFTIKLFSKNGKKKKDFLLYLPIVLNPKFQEESPEEKRRGVSCYEPLPFTRFSALFWTYNSELPPCYYYYYILSKAPDLGALTQNSAFKKKIPKNKVVFKIMPNLIRLCHISCYVIKRDYDFIFLKWLETVVTNHSFNFKFKAVVGDYGFDFF